MAEKPSDRAHGVSVSSGRAALMPPRTEGKEPGRIMRAHSEAASHAEARGPSRSPAPREYHTLTHAPLHPRPPQPLEALRAQLMPWSAARRMSAQGPDTDFNLHVQRAEASAEVSPAFAPRTPCSRASRVARALSPHAPRQQSSATLTEEDPSLSNITITRVPSKRTLDPCGRAPRCTADAPPQRRAPRADAGWGAEFGWSIGAAASDMEAGQLVHESPEGMLLHVQVMEAHGLPRVDDKDTDSLCFLVRRRRRRLLLLLTRSPAVQTLGNVKHRTRKIRGDAQPVWNQSYSLPVGDWSQPLHITVVDRARGGRLIGQARLLPSRLLANEARRQQRWWARAGGGGSVGWPVP